MNGMVGRLLSWPKFFCKTPQAVANRCCVAAAPAGNGCAVQKIASPGFFDSDELR